MNKIYRLVWSKIRNCYVVACEYAKRHSKVSIRSYSLLALVVSLTLLNNPVLAAGTESHYVSINSTSTSSGSNYNNDGASGANAIAIGQQATATAKNAVAIGYKAKAEGEGAFAFGEGAISKGKGTVAFIGGNEAYGTYSMAWGMNNIAGISVDEEAMNWDDVYDCTPQLEENIMTLKSMIYDIMKMPSTTEADINARNNAAESIFTTATEFLKSSGLHDLDYDLRSDITIVEKATIACMDGIMIAEALISYARIAQLSKVDTSSLLAEMMENAHFDISMDDLDNLMDTVKQQTSENPLPAMKEEAVQEEVNDENITS